LSRVWIAGVAVSALLAFAPAANAGDQGTPPKDYSGTALNIIPSGQPGAIPPPPGADTQAHMYDGLTPLFDDVSKSDLTEFFKSEKFGISTAGPGTTETVPRPGVTIVRDSYDVPHVSATTHAGGVWAAGWIAAEDRGALLQQARYNARVAAIDAPGLDAVSLIASLKSFQPSQQTEDVLAKQAGVLRRAGPEGKKVLKDIDTFVEGINDYLEAHGSSAAPFTRNDIFAFNALKDQFVGEGGGDEARRSQFLGGLEQRLGVRKGYSVFDDLRQNIVKGHPVTVDGHFRYEHAPKKPGAPGSAVLDPGSFTSTPAATANAMQGLSQPTERTQASNELMIDAKHSTTGHPELVGGPQIGYFYPGFTYEIDMHAGNLDWRGATSTPFPGYMLIGRGPDFATSLTSASGDVIDQFAEKLCDHSNTKYRYKGKCRSMQEFDAGTLSGDPVTFKTTVHGPVIGYATVNGDRVAISRQRSSYGKDSLDLLFNRRLSDGQVHSAKSFMKAASLTPQTFNSFYLDKKHTAMFSSGLLPKRAKGTDPSLPTWGTGRYEWHGFISRQRHIHGIDPSNTPVHGTMVNWNNISAQGFGAADDSWNGNGSAFRVDMLNKELRKQKNKHGKWSLADVTSAMNAAATQDIRAIDTVPLLVKLLKGSNAPNQQAAQMLARLKQWREDGGNRLDLNNDGFVDDPGAEIMDTAWPKIADALMRPQIGPQLDELNSIFTRFNGPPSGQNSGWYMYFDRDIRRLLGMKQPDPFENRYCGHGNLAKCQDAIWNAIASAGRELSGKFGANDPDFWHADANAERIHFVPGILQTTMRYTNRPSGIQQVITFNGHR
jgi:acyl-homoserine lactone acylase PvdQ